MDSRDEQHPDDMCENAPPAAAVVQPGQNDDVDGSACADEDRLECTERRKRDLYQAYISNILNTTLLRSLGDICRPGCADTAVAAVQEEDNTVLSPVATTSEDDVALLMMNNDMANVVQEDGGRLPTAAEFERSLLTELNRFGLLPKLIQNCACRHAYFVRAGSALEKSFNAVLAAMKKAKTPTLSFDYTLHGGENFWEHWNIHAFKSHALEPYIWHRVSHWSTPSRWSQSHPQHHARCGILLQNFRSGKDDNCVYAVPLRPAWNDRVYWIPVEHIFNDGTGQSYGACMTMLTDRQLREHGCSHACLICSRIKYAAQGGAYEVDDAIRHYYTRVRRELDDSDFYRCRLYSVVDPPKVPAEPWSIDHITRLINMTLFSLCQEPLDVDGWSSTYDTCVESVTED